MIRDVHPGSGFDILPGSRVKKAPADTIHEVLELAGMEINGTSLSKETCRMVDEWTTFLLISSQEVFICYQTELFRVYCT